MSLTFQENATAVVTGAGRGIGKEIAAVLAGNGVTVVCVSRTEANCEATAAAIRDQGGNARAMAVDVADADAVGKACADLNEEFGAINMLVNNAGITKDGMMLRMSTEDWHSVINTNLSSCFYWTKGLAGPMSRKRWGRIVNISSVIGVMGNAGQVNYSSAKAGMIGFTKSIAKELASRSVTCNAVAPGFIQTDMTSGLGDELSDQIIEKIPLKRIGNSSDIAHMVEFLCSDQGNYITGQVFTVDGGLVM